MILELDCGNSLIKWRVLSRNTQRVEGEGAASDEVGLVEQLDGALSEAPRMVRLVSVRGESETAGLIARLGTIYPGRILLAQSAHMLAGVTSGYLEPSSLGADRWLAVVAAFSLSRAACLVLDIGTAITADYVDSSGLHRGGFICPGLGLMRKQLGGHTRRIRYEASSEVGVCAPGRTTAQAVERGTELMMRGFIDTQIRQAHDMFGDKCRIILTGGDAAMVLPYVPEAEFVRDLVFRGLAIACPAEG